MKKNDHYFVGMFTPKAAWLQNVRATAAGCRHASKGMTLLELLIVIALLSIVALASTSLIIDTGEWKQQQATEEQWLNIKRSIIGDNVVDANYRREYSGFVVDMGRLPNCMRELVRPYDCGVDLYGDDDADTTNDAKRLVEFTQDIDSNQWHGWRGPYLGIPGKHEYRDGWDNHGRTDNTGNDDDVNYGWLFGTGANGTACQDAVVTQQQPGAIVLQSCGDDGDVDSTETGFPADYPYVEADGAYVPLITRHDYQISLPASWNEAPVNIQPTMVGQSRIIPADSLRLRVNYPIKNGSMPDLTGLIDLDQAPFLSEAFPVSARRLADAAGNVYTVDDSDSDLLTDDPGVAADVTVPTGTALSGTLVTVPNGVSSTLVFDDASELELQGCPCELEINAGTLLPPSTTLKGATTISIKPENIAPIKANIAKYVIEVPQATTPNTGTTTSLALPNGTTLTFSRAADMAYFPKVIWDVAGAQPTVTVSESFSIEGDLVETDSANDQFIVPSASSDLGNVITIEQAVPSIPLGLRNITLVCDVDGFLYDGNCTDNTAGSPTVYAPIATPYQLEVSSRSYVPVPNSIDWRIQ